MLSSYEKEENPGIYDDMDGPSGNYTKWDKPGRHTHTKKDILLYRYMSNLKKLNSLEVENRTVTEAWRWGNWKDVV